MQIVYWHISGDSDPVSPAVILYKYSLQNPRKPSFLGARVLLLVPVRTSKHGNEGVPVQNRTEKKWNSYTFPFKSQCPGSLLFFKKTFVLKDLYKNQYFT